MPLTHRFEQALLYAHQLHARQTRKGSAIPYIAHLLGVCALVLEDGGDEDEAIAALLHDAVEDQGGRATLEEIQSRFGVRVASIVESCSDAFTVPKPPWRARKEAYLAHLPQHTPSAVRVSLADKLHNARAILRDVRTLGPEVWARFNGGRDGTLWYYARLVEIFSQITHSPMVEELRATVECLHAVEK